MNLAHQTSSELHHLVALMSRESDQMLQEQLGIGLSQYKILKSILEQPHIRQKTIAQTLGQTEASISRQIKLLQKKGMLTANRNPNNLREHLVDLTSRGQRIIEAAEQVLRYYHGKFFAPLNEKEQKQLTDILKSLQN
jgi:MarR family transcriptional regulator for hemolysin